MTLRPYQAAAKTAVYEHLRTRDDNPCIVIPTAGGKTPLISSICHDAVTRWKGRVMILAHVKELLEQAVDKLRAVSPDLGLGVYSAGLKRRDTKQPVIVAGIQSVFRRACELGKFDLVIVDEAHLIPSEGEGMYRRFLADARVVNPQLRVIGATATAFRMKEGMICAPGNVLNHVCFEVGVRELIRDGFLCPLVTKAGTTKVDTSAIHVRAGEFVNSEVEGVMDRDCLVDAACREIIDYTTDRGSVLIFAAGVQHGRHVAHVIQDRHDKECGFICGETPSLERAALLDRFKSGALKFLANVNVLTMGFNAPNIDCVALLRPTMSPGLFYQMCGRGFRLHLGKRNCLVLDFGGNVMRHGPVDQIRVQQPGSGDGSAPAKECPECRALIATGYARCPHCRHKFPPPERTKHAPKATNANILATQYTDEVYEIRDVAYYVHIKRDAPPDAPKTMRVEYRVGLDHWEKDWICFEHGDFPRHRAVGWWQLRSSQPVPDTAEQAVRIADSGDLAEPLMITVRSVAGEKFNKIVDYQFDPLPELVPAACEEDDIPF